MHSFFVRRPLYMFIWCIEFGSLIKLSVPFIIISTNTLCIFMFYLICKRLHNVFTWFLEQNIPHDRQWWRKREREEWKRKLKLKNNQKRMTETSELARTTNLLFRCIFMKYENYVTPGVRSSCFMQIFLNRVFLDFFLFVLLKNPIRFRLNRLKYFAY